MTGQIRLRELSVGELDLTIVPRDFVAMDTPHVRRARARRRDVAAPAHGHARPARPARLGRARQRRHLPHRRAGPAGPRPGRADRRSDPRGRGPVRPRHRGPRHGRQPLHRRARLRPDRRDPRERLAPGHSGLPFDIEFSGDIEARKASYAEGGQVFGRIDLTRGTIQTLSRRFDLERGTITLNGDALAAVVDIAATLDIRLAGTIAGQSSATITLAVNGQLDDNPDDPALVEPDAGAGRHRVAHRDGPARRRLRGRRRAGGCRPRRRDRRALGRRRGAREREARARRRARSTTRGTTSSSSSATTSRPRRSGRPA